VSATLLDEAEYSGEPESGSVLFRREEGVEDAALVERVNTGTRVGDLQQNV
jgi:hypothetical protein